MTTIAYKGGVLAADSQETTGSRKGFCTKLFRIKSGRNKGHVVGLSGDTFAGMVFLDWYSGGIEKQPTFDPADEFHALILTPNGVFEADRFCRLLIVEEKVAAIGDGGDIAIAAMEHGKSAKEAVEYACTRNIYTSPPVRTMRLEAKRGKR